MNCYETLFVLKPTLTDEETASHIEKIKETLNKVGAELLATNEMGARKLAYEVAKNERGTYTILYYKSEGSAIDEIERNLKINEEVIKFLTIKYDNTIEVAAFNKQVESAGKAKAEPKEETKEQAEA